jgi:ribosomal protein S18 acetylase RimI-like enzyme
MNTLRVAKVLQNEISLLQSISRSTFYETFSEFNSESDMRNYLENDMSIQQLTTEWNNIGTEFYFAILNDDVIGYLKLNSCNSEFTDATLKGIEIARIYVLKEHHGNGAGQILFETAVTIANKKDCDYIWLGVWENNPRAIRFYEKNGFVKSGEKQFVLGNDIQTDWVMTRMF